MSTEEHKRCPSQYHRMCESLPVSPASTMYWEVDLYPAGSTLWKAPPGAGKTTLGLQFLREGRRRGERGLFITLSETNEELEVVAASHGWSLDGIDFSS